MSIVSPSAQTVAMPAGQGRLLRACLLALALAVPVSAARAETIGVLKHMSIEDLGNLQVTSVSKAPESIATAPAAVYVISHVDIVNSPATSIPELLRLAPNLQVAQTSPSDYVITARGLNGAAAAQNFSDKLLVLIDGRSVYNPLFSGMYWDMQDVAPENIERIEVISGPGATLWGANAVNGVVNIVTRGSDATRGGVLALGAGNQEVSGSLQYGGRLSEDLTWRAYVKAFRRSSFDLESGASAGNGWHKPQGGFRLDWRPGEDHVTVQGDLYAGREDRLGVSDLMISGGNIQATWRHEFADGSSVQVLGYYDRVRRVADDRNGGFSIDTFNVELQHNFTLGSWNDIVWGIGQRYHDYSIDDEFGAGTALLFRPASGQLKLTNLFLQDRISLTDDIDVTLGVKLEVDSYSGLTPMPSIRATWRASDRTMFWAAASRAIRSPTPFDVDVVEMLGDLVFLTGNPDFRPEKLTAFEIGYRGQWSKRLLVAVSLFDSEYDNLKSIEISPTVFPLLWGNLMKGRIYGVEAWASFQATDWWRLSAGVTFQEVDMRFKPGASQLVGLSQAGNDPHRRATLRSTMDITDRLRLDADLRYTSRLPEPRVPGYVELNLRLGWDITDDLELSVAGLNLLHRRHLEYTVPPAVPVKRSFFIHTRRKF